MLRCSRLIEKTEPNPMFAGLFQSIAELQPGDRMTGWEIIASLPLEEQMNLTRSGIMTVLFDNDSSDKIMINELSRLYEYDGNQWVEAKE